MAFEIVAMCGGLAAMVCAGPNSSGSLNQPGYYDGGRALATRMPYPAGRADSVRRPGFNGRVWISRPIIGPEPRQQPLDWSDPGPGAYGAAESDAQTVYVRVGQVVVSISPWVAVQGTGMQHIEQARQDWLKEQGYIGGVRTFMNDAHMRRRADAGEVGGVAMPASAKKIEPRATIQLSPETPRFRSKMQVKTNPTTDSPVATFTNG